MVKVAIVRCESYKPDLVYKEIKRGIKLIGGLNIKPNEKILLKVNNLVGDAPECLTTTNPAILEAMIKILQEGKVTVLYGDSPAFEKPSSALGKSGFNEVAGRYGVKLADFENGKDVDGFHLAKGCLEAGIISLPKMKTHAYQKITGAVKNQFGCIVGLHKAAFHVKKPEPAGFAKMLLKLNGKLKPRLYIMDGIMAMEGNGPRGGDARKMNCIIISADAVAVDTAFCKIIGLNPLLVPVIRYAKRQSIEYVGDPIDSFVNKSFKIDRHPASMLPQFIRKLRKPVIDSGKCVRCGVCVKQCPVKALSFKDKRQPPVYDYGKCIRCYCCQELCPSKAIEVKSFFHR